MTLTTIQIEEERRRGRLAGAAAIVAGILLPTGLFWSQGINNDRPTNNDPDELRFFDSHATELLLASTLRAIAFALVAVVAMHLYTATKARNPGLTPFVKVMGVAGPLTAAAGGLAHDLYLAFAAADFTGREFQTIQDAKDLLDSPVRLAMVGASLGGTLALAFWFVLGSMNAMRVGLLSRFMGILGIIIGPAFVFGLAPLVMVFWLIAVGALFLGRWPGGLPPAWDAGEAIAWPARGRQAAPPGTELEPAPGSHNGEVEAVGPGVRDPDDQTEVGPQPVERRKRKRRR